ncbi:ABC-type transporter Mla maintaining outer membrane lipid asymmetry, periplasmic component MlaD [Mycobacterium numidiamassiliense]|uniref:ABC-type transporter Mla maintaining outer membrane lipid asymmetry, periplasmic component MlaD n=1 Tax=Mycobacterium numidiamassiliense TaxID=1841861 RepID=A0A2U3PAL3_9MYCO|nr:MCE family protein [Mycobacterium numidiamassiliense]SPM40807.1 ABC-type transporter Mla maintaining outer membrane lipid asymmetry, periplasmic component MlaD [Mycobacterium numidiamassiliense]
MRTFSERNPLTIGAIGLGITFVVMLLALNYDKLPFFQTGRTYSAYFAEAGGLVPGNAVQVSGFRVGQVSSVELDGARVLVKFHVNGDVHLGDRTEAAIKLKTVLGTKLLAVTPRGEGQLTGPIPLDRTRPAYQLPDALGDLTTTISGLKTDQLSNSLAVLADTFSDTPPDLKAAVQGLARFSKSLDERDTQLRDLLGNANKATKVLSERSDEIVNLVAKTNALLVQLKSQSSALDQISNNLSAVAQQVKGFIAENRSTLKPALDKLNEVLTIVDNRKERVQKALTGLNSFSLRLGETVSSGPFYEAYVANLLPGQFVQPFIDAAFSDLGLDPNVLLPTQRADPEVGQPATPPLPIPFPRTGQGGEPRMNIPDAITGNPGDHPCGVPGVALPGPGCYPYREPPPAPPPGGPPPGPPAPAIAPPDLPGEGGGQ